MQAIEINSKTDKAGLLKLNCHLHRPNSAVRVILLLEDGANEEDERLWLSATANNPAFDFLNDPAEDIYSLSNGQPLDD